MWNIYQYDELDSTQAEARRMLDSGIARNGDVIQALHQSAGKGRGEGRAWYDEVGKNLLMSVILTDLSESSVRRLQFVSGVAVVRAIRTLVVPYGIPADTIRLKWVNDVLIRMKKTAGLLCETTWSGSSPSSAVIGIGVNVNQQSFPVDTRLPAASLMTETGEEFAVDTVRSVILQSFAGLLRRDLSDDEFFDMINTEFGWLAQVSPFDVLLGDQTLLPRVTYSGISADGGMIVSDEYGKKRVITNGSIILQ